MEAVNRDKKGKFANKSCSERKVKSMRVAEEVWEEAGNIAAELGITRADLFENMIKNYHVIHGDNGIPPTLQEALKLKANSGGAIKKKIREYLSAIGPDK